MAGTAILLSLDCYPDRLPGLGDRVSLGALYMLGQVLGQVLFVGSRAPKAKSFTLVSEVWVCIEVEWIHRTDWGG